MLVPGSLALISVSFSQETRGRAIGTWSGFTAITAAIGPVLGGWLIEQGSWRWVFFINLPLGLSVLALTWLKIPESRGAEAGARIDWPGALLATVSGIAANQLEAFFRRRERERAAALLFGEVLSTLRVILEGAERTRHVGVAYGPVTRRMLHAARREIDIYERNR